MGHVFYMYVNFNQFTCEHNYPLAKHKPPLTKYHYAANSIITDEINSENKSTERKSFIYSVIRYDLNFMGGRPLNATLYLQYLCPINSNAL